VDFHPTQPWLFVSIERQNQIYVYKMEPDGSVAKDPLFVKTSLAEPNNVRKTQGAGGIKVHPNGRFVYLTNRNSGIDEVDGKKVFAGGENNVAVFAVNPQSGETTLIQNADMQTIHPRTLSLDPTGKLLVAASILPMGMKDGSTWPAAQVVYRVGDDGKLTFARKYDVDTGKVSQWWTGFVALA
jgi:6-phosphogluconolactonase (cycloisomerase 2 family)